MEAVYTIRFSYYHTRACHNLFSIQSGSKEQGEGDSC
jgi:hypothetical protein